MSRGPRSKPHRKPPGRPRRTEAEEFGWEEPVPTVDVRELEGPAGEIQPPDPEIVALGPPPADASGIQKWNYQMLSIMAYKAAIDPTLTNEQRMKRAAQLTAAAARHYPEAAKYDLANRIAVDNEAIASRKRARAMAKLERCPPAGAAKVIPIRRDAQGS